MRNGTIAKETLQKAYMMFAFFVNIMVTMYMIVNDDNTMQVELQYAHYIRLIFCAVWFICAWWYFSEKHINHTIHNTPKLFQWFTIFIIGTCISLFVTHTGNIKQLIANVLIFIAPLLSLLGSYNIAFQYEKKNDTFVIIMLTILACLYSYFSIYSTYNILGERGHFGVAYYALYLLPIMLACDKRWLRVISILIVSVIIVSSIKRGGLIALVLGLFAYLLASQFISKKGLKTAIILFITLVVLVILFYVLIKYLGDNIIERLSDRDDETGSGRLDIWNGLIQRLSMQDFEFWIFGNGHLSTTKYSWENLTAHNDFLEIIYNYGIFNFIFYVLFFGSTTLYTITAIRQKNTYAPALAAILTIFAVLSVVSIIILSHTCVLVMISIGTLVGWSEQERKRIEQP